MEKLNLKKGEVQVFDQILPKELYIDILKILPKIGWSFGWNTPSNPNQRYWHHEIGYGGKDNVDDVCEKILEHPFKPLHAFIEWIKKNITNDESKIIRYYLNAHTFGTDGWPHTDSDVEGQTTAVLYLTTQWKKEWCGETVIFDENGDIKASVIPKPNRMVTFPSNYVHSPRPLSKVYEGLRVVLVVKLIPINI